MQASQHDTADESTADRPDELGLFGEPATYAPPDEQPRDVTVRGSEHDEKTDTWTVWIETAGGEVYTAIGEHVIEVGA
jgi:hypothetical protein